MGYDFLIEDISKIIENIDKYSTQINSDKLFKMLMLAMKNCNLDELLNNNMEALIKYCETNKSLYNYYLILGIKVKKIKTEECDKYLKSIDDKIAIDTKRFIMKHMMRMKKNEYYDFGKLFSYMIEDLQSMDATTASKIIIDLYKFSDFKTYLKLNKQLLSTLLDAYYIYVPELYGDRIFNGATVISKLLNDTNETILETLITKVIGDKYRTTENIKMIGCGGSNMVFKIGEKVLKIGIERSNRKIFINHRILKSEFRKLITSDDDKKPEYYAEIMHYIDTGDVTKEELEELKLDLYQQGLIWHDTKTSNCGVLPQDYDNDYVDEIDYNEVAANISIPTRKLQFNQRKRRVVILDSDDMEMDYRRTSG